MALLRAGMATLARLCASLATWSTFARLMAQLLTSMKAAVENSVACLPTRDARSVAGHIGDDVLATQTALLNKEDARWTVLIFVAIVLLLGVATRRWRSSAWEMASDHRPTRHRWIQDCSSTVTGKLLEARLKTWRAWSAVTGHGTAVKSAFKRLCARHIAIVQASWVLFFELPR